MNHMALLFYTYQAGAHCPKCARAIVGQAVLDDVDHVFSDGTTVGAVHSFETGDWTDGASCYDCRCELIEPQKDGGAWNGDDDGDDDDSDQTED